MTRTRRRAGRPPSPSSSSSSDDDTESSAVGPAARRARAGDAAAGADTSEPKRSRTSEGGPLPSGTASPGAGSDSSCCHCPHLLDGAAGRSLLNRRTLKTIGNPSRWNCDDCGTTDGIWACLHCPHFACGRLNKGHALAHFEATQHPLVMEITTKCFHCYLCDNYVMNDTPDGALGRLREQVVACEGNDATAMQPPREHGRRKAALLDRDKAVKLDRLHTATALYNNMLLRRVFRALRSAVQASRAARQADEAPPETPPAARRRRPGLGRGLVRSAAVDLTASEEGGDAAGDPLLEPAAGATTGAPAAAAAAAPAGLRTRRSGAGSEASSARAGSPEVELREPAVAGSTSARPSAAAAAAADVLVVATPSRSVGPSRRLPSLMPGMTGLRNLGQTCFMNAVLQALAHSPVFRVGFGELGKLGLLKLDTARQHMRDLLEHRIDVPRSRAIGRRPSFRPQFMRQTTVECRSRVEAPVRMLQRSAWRRAGALAGGAPASGAAGAEGGAAPPARRQAVHADAGSPLRPRSTQGSAAPSAGPASPGSVDSASVRGSPGPDGGTAEGGGGGGGGVTVCQDLDELFRVMWSGRWSVVTPHSLLNTVWRLIPSFRGFKQQDAQELLIELQDRIEDEVREIAKLLDTAASVALPWPMRMLLASFDGHVQQSVTCSHCGHVSTLSEPFCDLSLDFPAGRRAASELCDMLDLFVAPETVEGYMCDECSRDRAGAVTHRTATKQNRVSRLPGSLHLHLKRFQWSGTRREKLQGHVAFPVELDLRPYCDESAWEGTFAAEELGLEEASPEFFKYDLTGVVAHDGRGINAGHYTSDCFNPVANTWVHFNDSRVSATTLDSVLQDQAYILFYSHRATAREAGTLLDPESTSPPFDRTNHPSS